MTRNERTFHPSQAHRLEDPARLGWLPPGEVAGILGLAPGMKVADIGAGTGYFALPFARLLAPGGGVMAVDFEPDMLKLLRAKLEQPGAPANVELYQGAASMTGLPAACCDIAFLANVWHEISDPSAALAEAARILVPTGRLAILDWRHDASPPPGPPSAHRISVATVESTLAAAGWRTLHFGPTGAYSYLVVATR